MLDHLETRRDGHVAFRSRGLERARFIQRNIMAIIAPMRRGRRRRAAIADLEGLTDQLLADIGISRDEIARVVDGLASGDARAALPQVPVAGVEGPREELRRAA